MNNKNVIQSVVCILAIDEKIDSKEYQFLREISQRLNVSDEMLTEILEDAKQGKRRIHIPKSSDEKIELMALLFEAASIDGIFAPQEQDALKKIAARMDVDKNDFEKLVNKYFVASSSTRNAPQNQESKNKLSSKTYSIKQKQNLNESKNPSSLAASKITLTRPQKDRSQGFFAKLKKTVKKVALALFLWSILFIVLAVMFPKFRHEVTWLWVSYENQPQRYAWFVESFPQARHIQMAKERYDRQVWENALRINTIQGYTEYFQQHPDGNYVNFAKKRREDLAWEETTQEDTLIAYQNYLQNYPEGRFVAQAKDTVEPLVWQEAKKENTINAYQNYLDLYPDGGTFHLLAKEYIIWLQTRKENTGTAYENYLEAYPEGQFVEQATLGLEPFIWQRTETENTEVAYENYLQAYPEGQFVEQAMLGLEPFVWQRTETENTEAAYENYLQAYPEGQFVEQATLGLEPFVWQQALDKRTIESFEGYIGRYPDGHFVDRARVKIAVIKAEQKRASRSSSRPQNRQPHSSSDPFEGMSCHPRKNCYTMANCSEAFYQFNKCGYRDLDDDGDGLPCENICGEAD